MPSPHRFERGRRTPHPGRLLVPCLLVPALAAGLVLAPSGARADVVTVTASQDNSIYQESLANSDGAGKGIFAGKNNRGSTGQVRRALVRFDLSAIPTNATVTNVSLVLTETRHKAGTYDIALHRVLASWGEGATVPSGEGGQGGAAAADNTEATWSHRFYPDTPWATAGGDFVSTASATVATSSEIAYAWSTPAMITDVQGWVSNPATNFGWIVRGIETSKATTRRFGSRTADTPSQRPQLTVTYTGAVATGACCQPDQSCSVVTPTQCTSSGGTYQGDGTVCSPNPCLPPVGACCLPSGLCDTLSATQCAAAGGTYQGDGSVCTPGLCPVLLTPFVDPLPIPALAVPVSGTQGGAATYEIRIQQIQQKLHRDLPATTLWGYAGSYPGPTILATRDQEVQVTWINDLKDGQGNYLTAHPLTVDTCTVMGMADGAMPRLVVHLHGGHVGPESDGYPEDTFLPGASATTVYPNHQLPATLWYHDHAMGITRLNVMMGLAGFYLLGDATESALGLPSGPYEMGLAIQDRSVNPDGSLQYPAMWMEHFFGDKILVNGKIWPYLNVARGKYRFRILDGSNSRVYALKLSNGAPFWVLGEEGGLLPAPVRQDSLILSPGERRDVVVDFAPYPAGTEIVLTNSAPAPYPGTPGEGVVPNVMKFVVQPEAGQTAPLPASLRPLERLAENTAVTTRTLQLQKVADACAGSRWTVNGLDWKDITETPVEGTTEIWRFVNQSGFVHPMHLHLVMFQVLDRQAFTMLGDSIAPVGPVIPPDSVDAGWKDTVPVNPGEMVRVIARFDDFTGKYPYHCHVLEHEDYAMMRQFEVVPPVAVRELPGGTDLALGASVPNPSRGTTGFAFRLPVAGRVLLTLEDIAGRRVATLAHGRMTAGAHTVLWQGRNDAGARVASGVYFYRLLFEDGRSLARRIVLVR